MIKFVFFLFLSLFFCTVTQAFKKESLLTYPDEKSVTALLDLFDKAERKILISFYRIDDERVTQKIIETARRGIQIKVLMNHPFPDSNDINCPQSFKPHKSIPFTTSKLIKNQLTFDLFNKESNIVVGFTNTCRHFLSHQKFMVIDGKIALISTGNLNSSGFHNRNFSLVFKDSETVKFLTTLFDLDFMQSEMKTLLADPKLAAVPSALGLSGYQPPLPSSYLLKTHARIHSAKESIYVYQPSLSDVSICELLASKSNIKIKILTSRHVFDKNEMEKNDVLDCISMLQKQENIEIKYLDEPFYYHAKVLIIDPFLESQEVLIGSMNWFHEALFFSRELGVFTKNKKTIKAILDTFNEDWAISDF